MNRYALTQAQIANWVRNQSLPAYRARQLWQALIVDRVPVEQATALPLSLRNSFAEAFPLALTQIRAVQSADGTRKWLSEAAGGAQIETVLMPSPSRASVCISTQAGCAMGCTFCATGQAGFERHLEVDEMLEQVLLAAHHSRTPVTHVVLMGMGEPLANYERVVELLHRLNTDLEISARRLTVSTVGIVPKMLTLAEDAPAVTLAVSLHAATDEARARLIPLNRRYPIANIVEAAREFSRVRGRRVTFEYTAISGENDSDDDAHALGTLLRTFGGAGGAHVNFIPLNPTGAFVGAASRREQLVRATAILAQYGVTATIRRPRGVDIDAACGQLRSLDLKSTAAISR